MSDILDIGTLSGRIEIEDYVSPAFIVIEKTLERGAEAFGEYGVAVVAAVGLATTAVIGLTASIVAMGLQGNTIADITDSFNHLAEEAGQVGEVLLGKLKEGVHDTVTDFELMKVANRSLQGGVKLTADNMLLLGKAAKTMADATGRDTLGSLEMFNQALLTGRVRGLQMAGVLVDTKTAQRDLAAELGVSIGRLTQEGELQANRNAILKAAAVYLDRLGESQLDFGDRVDQVKTKIANWWEELQMGIARSTELNEAVDALGKAFTEAFGHAGETATRTILTWVNKFATAITTYGPRIVKWLGEAVDYIENIYHAVLNAWNTVPDWFKNLAGQAALAAGGLYLMNTAVGSINDAMVGTIASFATITSGTLDLKRELTGLIPLLLRVNTGLKELIGMTATWGIEGFLVTIRGWFAPLVAGLSSLMGWFTGLGTTAAGFGTILAEIATGPVGWTVLAVTTLVGALRLLTGSWEFITTPIRAAWQAFTDTLTVARFLVGLLGNELSPILQDVSTLFSVVAQAVSEDFTNALRVAKVELEIIWQMMKDLPGPLNQMITALQLLHGIAQGINAGNKPPYVNDHPTVENDMRGHDRELNGGLAPVHLARPKPNLLTDLEQKELDAFKEQAADLDREIQKQLTYLQSVGFNAEEIFGVIVTKFGQQASELVDKANVTKGAVEVLTNATLVAANLQSTLPIISQAEWAKTQKSITDNVAAMGDKNAQKTSDLYFAEKELRGNLEQLSASGTARELLRIQTEWDAKKLSNMRQYDNGSKLYHDLTAETDVYYQHQMDLANRTAGTIIERLREQGVVTRSEMARSTAELQADYELMRGTNQYTLDQMLDAWLAWRHAVNAQTNEWSTAFIKVGDLFGQELSKAAGELTDIGDLINSHVLKAAGNVLEKINGWVSGLTSAVKLIQSMINLADNVTSIFSNRPTGPSGIAGHGFDLLNLGSRFFGGPSSASMVASAFNPVTGPMMSGVTNLSQLAAPSSGMGATTGLTGVSKLMSSIAPTLFSLTSGFAIVNGLGHLLGDNGPTRSYMEGELQAQPGDADYNPVEETSKKKSTATGAYFNYFSGQYENMGGANPFAKQNPMVVQLKVGARTLAQVIVPEIPGEVRRLGLA